MLSQLPSMYSAQGIFQLHFQCKKVRTILNKMQFLDIMTLSIRTLSILMKYHTMHNDT
jgi:hypothetical protein